MKNIDELIEGVEYKISTLDEEKDEHQLDNLYNYLDYLYELKGE